MTDKQKTLLVMIAELLLDQMRGVATSTHTTEDLRTAIDEVENEVIG